MVQARYHDEIIVLIGNLSHRLCGEGQMNGGDRGGPRRRGLGRSRGRGRERGCVCGWNRAPRLHPPGSRDSIGPPSLQQQLKFSDVPVRQQRWQPFVHGLTRHFATWVADARPTVAAFALRLDHPVGKQASDALAPHRASEPESFAASHELQYAERSGQARLAEIHELTRRRPMHGQSPLRPAAAQAPRLISVDARRTIRLQEYVEAL
mmetsp:Transcript_1873/g.6875  ORF Transcript_1873/g.6875 Transcript_1873/m.6875 type:complete len:208 (-) Transcript_1873:827-1450(-)